jgi:hypothetical protein
MYCKCKLRPSAVTGSVDLIESDSYLTFNAYFPDLVMFRRSASLEFSGSRMITYPAQSLEKSVLPQLGQVLLSVT